MMVIKPQAFKTAAEYCLWSRKNGRISVGFQEIFVLSLYRRVVQRLGRSYLWRKNKSSTRTYMSVDCGTIRRMRV